MEKRDHHGRNDRSTGSRAGVDDQAAPAIHPPASDRPAAPAGPVDRLRGPSADPGLGARRLRQDGPRQPLAGGSRRAPTPGSRWTSRTTTWPPSCSTWWRPFGALTLRRWPRSSNCCGRPRSLAAHPAGRCRAAGHGGPPRSLGPRARRLSRDQDAGGPHPHGAPGGTPAPARTRGPDHSGRSAAAAGPAARAPAVGRNPCDGPAVQWRGDQAVAAADAGVGRQRRDGRVAGGQHRGLGCGAAPGRVIPTRPRRPGGLCAQDCGARPSGHHGVPAVRGAGGPAASPGRLPAADLAVRPVLCAPDRRGTG